MLVCKVCGKKFQLLTSHVKRTHGLSKEDYLDRFPGSVFILTLEDYIKNLGQTLEATREQLQHDLAEVDLRELSDKEAKVEVLRLLTEQPDQDAYDVHLALNLDFDQVKRVSQQLMEEGLLEWS